MTGDREDWDEERRTLLGRRISDLGLRIEASPLQPLVEQLYGELRGRGLVFRPPVYLSDQWGCPSGVPLIGVPFYLADARLARIEEEVAVEVEGAGEAMKYLRHEAGHAFNYAYRLYDRADWRATFGPYSRPYRERFHADPFSRDHVRHILAWYAQKHPDEDFAESFAVWLTPGLDWRREYEGWGALRKLEYVDRVMAEVGGAEPETLVPRPEHLPVDAMHYTVAEHYTEAEGGIPVPDETHFDGDLRTIFPGDDGAPETGESAASFIRERLKAVALDAFHALRLRDYARVDLRVAADGEVYVIEANPNCYLERGAEFARAAAAAGLDYDALIRRIVELASARYAR